MEKQEMEAVAEKVLRRLFLELEASGRHVHVTKQQAVILFGHGLTPKRPLSQPGQYLARERVTVIGPKGCFEEVAVLGPERPEGQVEHHSVVFDGGGVALVPGQLHIAEFRIGIQGKFFRQSSSGQAKYKQNRKT